MRLVGEYIRGGVGREARVASWSEVAKRASQFASLAGNAPRPVAAEPAGL